jgi:hypothetical protein
MNDKKTSSEPRYDNAGHMNPAHAEHLLELSRAGKETSTDKAFVGGTRSHDPLAEELAESAVAAMTSGEDQLTADLAAEVTEERGGPFVPSAAGAEFAEGTDDSNIAEATREPFPTT